MNVPQWTDLRGRTSTDIYRNKRYEQKPYMYNNGYHSTPLVKILYLLTKQAIVVIVVSKLNL